MTVFNPLCSAYLPLFCVCLFILFFLEKLVSSKEPESYAVWSFAPGRVTHGGKVKGEVPDKVRSNQDLNGGPDIG